MLISQVASGAKLKAPPPRSAAAAESIPEHATDLESLKVMCSSLRSEINDARKDELKRTHNYTATCFVLDGKHSSWIRVQTVVSREGVLKVYYADTDDVFATLSLRFSAVIGHIFKQMLQISSKNVEILLFCEPTEFVELAAILFTWARIRPAGILQKLWYPPIKLASSQSMVLLSCELEARSTFDAKRIKWESYLARLNKDGYMQFYDSRDKKYHFGLKISEILASRIVLVDKSVAGTDKMILLFPDMGGPNSYYLRFKYLDDVEDWLATLKSFAKQSVASPLLHDARRSFRWHKQLQISVHEGQMINLQGSQTVYNLSTNLPPASPPANAFTKSNSANNLSSNASSLLNAAAAANPNSKLDLRGAYVDICWNNWTFARTCINASPGFASWNQSFIIPAPESAVLGSVFPFKIQLKLRRLNYASKDKYSDQDPVLGEVTLNLNTQELKRAYEVQLDSRYRPYNREREREKEREKEKEREREKERDKDAESAHGHNHSHSHIHLGGHLSGHHSSNNDTGSNGNNSNSSSNSGNGNLSPSSNSFGNPGPSIELIASISMTDTETLDQTFYEKLRQWVTDLDLQLSIKLGKYSSSGDDLIKIFSDLYSSQGNQIEWIMKLVENETAQVDLASHTLFRGSSFMTRAVELLFLQQGEPALRDTVGAFIVHLQSTEDTALELDPSRLKEGDSLEKNTEQLKSYCTKLWSLIKVHKVPAAFNKVFQCMRFKLEARKLDEEFISKIMQKTLASFLFLRYYCPALLNPHLFNLTNRILEPGHRRTVILVAKVLQGFANGVNFGSKENWLIPMNAFIDENSEDLKKWYNGVCETQGLKSVDSNVNLERLPKIVPVKTFLGQRLTSPNLIDEWATYAKLVNFIMTIKDKRSFETEAESDDLLNEVYAECKSISARKDAILQDLEKEDTFKESLEGSDIDLHFNTKTALFGLNGDLIEDSSLNEKRHVVNTDTYAVAPDLHANKWRSVDHPNNNNNTKDPPRDRLKTSSVRRITQLLKLSK